MSGSNQIFVEKNIQRNEHVQLEPQIQKLSADIEKMKLNLPQTKRKVIENTEILFMLIGLLS